MYLPCALIVVLSWVGFWLNREATSDRVTLGWVTIVLILFVTCLHRSDLCADIIRHLHGQQVRPT